MITFLGGGGDGLAEFTGTLKINKLREEYEAGKSLIQIAIDDNLSYNSLKNYASKNKWKKGIRKDLLAAERILDNDEQVRKKKEEALSLIQGETKSLLELFGAHDEVEGKGTSATQSALKARAQALECVTNVATKVFSLETDAETIERKLNQLEYNKQLELIEYKIEIEKLKIKETKLNIKELSKGRGSGKTSIFLE